MIKETREMTLAELVLADNRNAGIFERFELDFCCKGKRTLQDACIEKKLPVENLLTALNSVQAERAETNTMSFSEMSAEQLISHILLKHHFYIRQAVPQLINYLSKLHAKHAAHFDWIEEGFYTFMLLQQELLTHMQKEELVLFPAIKKLEEQTLSGKRNNPDFNFSMPVAVMESEHEEAGRLVHRLRVITNNYTPDPKACTTHQVTLAALKEFEENLHQHIHLENNILFPKALALQVQ